MKPAANQTNTRHTGFGARLGAVRVPELPIRWAAIVFGNFH
jgi:hypothetical protein